MVTFSDPGAKFLGGWTNRIHLNNIPFLRNFDCGVFLLNRLIYYPSIEKNIKILEAMRSTHSIGLSFNGIPNLSIMLYYTFFNVGKCGDIPQYGVGFNVDLN